LSNGLEILFLNKNLTGLLTLILRSLPQKKIQ
jgi:hypothetical protein